VEYIFECVFAITTIYKLDNEICLATLQSVPPHVRSTSTGLGNLSLSGHRTQSRNHKIILVWLTVM
jgi:hypothetical protein